MTQRKEYCQKKALSLVPAMLLALVLFASCIREE